MDSLKPPHPPPLSVTKMLSMLPLVSLRKNTKPEIGVRLFVFFTFFINFFMKKLIIKSKIYWQTVPLNHLFMYLVKIVYQTSLPSFLI